MRNLFAVLLMVAGLALGLYVGVWLMFIGGIVQIIDAVKATPVEAMPIAIGLLRLVCAGAVGFVAAAVAIFPGYAMFKA